MATTEELLIKEMNLDNRGLPLLSEEEMQARGIFYNKSAGAYQYDDPNKVSVSVPGEGSKTFVPNEASMIRLNESEIAELDKGRYLNITALPRTTRVGNVYRGEGKEWLGEGFEASPYLVDDYVGPAEGQMGEYGISTPLAYRRAIGSYDGSGPMSDVNRPYEQLHQFQNLAAYLDQTVDVQNPYEPETIYKVDDAGNVVPISEESTYSQQMEMDDLKQLNIDQMSNILMNTMDLDENVNMSAAYLSPDYQHDPNINVLDIVKAQTIAHERASRAERYGNEFEKQMAIKRDLRRQEYNKDAYEEEREGWWLGKYLGRDKPNPQYIINESGRYQDVDSTDPWGRLGK